LFFENFQKIKNFLQIKKGYINFKTLKHVELEVINKIKFMHITIYINVGQVFCFKDINKIHTLNFFKDFY